MPKRISVDAALADNRPYIQFRGVDYILRDWTVRERLSRLVEARNAQEALQEAQAEQEALEVTTEEELDEDVVAGQIQALYTTVLQDALVAFPEEVAVTVTEQEFEALKQAITVAREMVFPVPTAQEVKEEDLKKAGAAVTG